MAKEDRGFASMDRSKQREIASKGGRAAHVKGTAHEWSAEEARVAGRKGGLASHSKRRPLPPSRSPSAVPPGAPVRGPACDHPAGVDIVGGSWRASAATYYWEVVQR